MNFLISLSSNISFKWIELPYKLSAMFGENFEIYLHEIARIAFKLSTMVVEFSENYLPEMARIAFKLSTVVGEILASNSYNCF